MSLLSGVYAEAGGGKQGEVVARVFCEGQAEEHDDDQQEPEIFREPEAQERVRRDVPYVINGRFHVV